MEGDYHMVRLYAHGGSGNHGCEAIVRTTVKMLESQAVLATTAPEEDRRCHRSVAYWKAK